MASTGPYASLHLAPGRLPCQHPTTQFFTGRMPFLPPNQQLQSTEGSGHGDYQTALPIACSVARGQLSYYSQLQTIMQRKRIMYSSNSRVFTYRMSGHNKGILLTHEMSCHQPLKCLFFLQLIASQIGKFTKQQAMAGLAGLCENFHPTASNLT